MELTTKQQEVIKILHDLKLNFGIKVNSFEEGESVLKFLSNEYPYLKWNSGDDLLEYYARAICTDFKGFPLVLDIIFKDFSEISLEDVYFMLHQTPEYKSIYTPLSYTFDLSKC